MGSQFTARQHDAHGSRGRLPARRCPPEPEGHGRAFGPDGRAAREPLRLARRYHVAISGRLSLLCGRQCPTGDWHGRAMRGDGVSRQFGLAAKISGIFSCLVAPRYARRSPVRTLPHIAETAVLDPDNASGHSHPNPRPAASFIPDVHAHHSCLRDPEDNVSALSRFLLWHVQPLAQELIWLYNGSITQPFRR